MEKAGLVRRESDAEDRRVARVFITAKGRKAHDRAETAFREVEVSCFAGFSPEEKAAFMDGLGRIYSNLRPEGRER